MASLLIQHHYGDNSTTEFSFPFPYITARDILVYVAGKPTGDWVLNSSGTAVVLPTPPANDALITIERYTDTTPLVGFMATAVLLKADLNLSALQTLHIAETASDLANATILFNPRLNVYDAKGRRITNVGIPLSDEDVATKAYLEAAIAAANFPLPDPADIAAAEIAMYNILLAIQTDAAAAELAADAIRADIAELGDILDLLYDLLANPPPDGATIVSRLDAYFGSTVWRDPIPAVPPATETFTGDGTWTKPDQGYAVLVECWGGGGSGASHNSTYQFYGPGSSCTVAMPGGGGGAYNRRVIPFDDLPDTVAVTVGVGGIPSGNYTDPSRDGEASSFGSFCVAHGGKAPPSPMSGGGGGGPMSPSTGLATGASGYLTNQQLGGLPALGKTIHTRSGSGGIFPPFTHYVYPGLKAIGGFYHGGGGGAGQKHQFTFTVPVRTPVTSPPTFSNMDGASSIFGGGGGGGGYTFPALAGQPTSYGYMPPGAMWPQQARYTVSAFFSQGLGGSSVAGGRGGDGGSLGQNGQDGGVRGGGGGGAGVAAGNNYMQLTSGPLGGSGGRGEVRITVL